MSDRRRVIRLFPEWGSEWPLWENEHPDYNTTPADYGLSPELTARIRRWADDWEANLDINAGRIEWRGRLTWKTWVTEGRRIAESIGWEVEAFADVAYNVSPDAH